jgi:lipoprotein NlpI
MIKTGMRRAGVTGWVFRLIVWVVLSTATMNLAAGSRAHADPMEDARAGSVALVKDGDAPKAIELLSHSLASDQLSPLNEALVHSLRGDAFLRLGDYKKGIADYETALDIQPSNSIILNNRALAYSLSGDYDAAMADYDRALQIGTNSYRSFFGRGVILFVLRNYSEAARDFAESLRLNPSRVYSAIWLYLAHTRMGKLDTKDLEKYAPEEAGAQTKWPTPIVALLLKVKSEDSIWESARKGSENEKLGQVCEANFYIGEYESIHGNREKSQNLFKNAIRDCPRDFYELVAARNERLGESREK